MIDVCTRIMSPQLFSKVDHALGFFNPIKTTSRESTASSFAWDNPWRHERWTLCQPLLLVAWGWWTFHRRFCFYLFYLYMINRLILSSWHHEVSYQLSIDHTFIFQIDLHVFFFLIVQGHGCRDSIIWKFIQKIASPIDQVWAFNPIQVTLRPRISLYDSNATLS